MRTFLALYRGATVGEAELVAITADPTLIADVADRLLIDLTFDGDDPVLVARRDGARQALKLVIRSAIAEMAIPRI